MKTAILVDGGFYNKRAKKLFGEKSPSERAKELEYYCKLHLNDKHEQRDLYRVFYYDCPPIDKVVYHPFTKKSVQLGKSQQYKWSMDFLDELKAKRKFALRLGTLSDVEYIIKPESMKQFLSGKRNYDSMCEDDFRMVTTQKGVDMKIGVDISSMAFKQQVNQIILISGDSDFVPAAKLARREGIDFILDPMEAVIRADLQEHIDGLRSKVKILQKNAATEE